MWLQLDKHADPDLLGAIPSFLDADDPDPAAKQLDKHYGHGGGWRPSAGWTIDEKGVARYPGDPALKPLFASVLRDEVILVYLYGYVAVIQPDQSFEICRMD